MIFCPRNRPSNATGAGRNLKSTQVTDETIKNFAPDRAMVYTKGGYRSLNVIIVGLNLKDAPPKNTEKRTTVLRNVMLQEDIFQAIIHIPVPHAGKSLEDMPPRFTLRMCIVLKSVSLSY